MPDIFLDAHMHLWEFSLLNSFQNLEKASSLEEWTSLMHSKPVGEWLVGVRLNPQKLRDKLIPDRWLLDKCFGRRPTVVIWTYMHQVSMNTAAMERLEMSSENGLFYQNDVYAIPNRLYQLGNMNPGEIVKQGWGKLAALGYGRVIDMAMDKYKRPHFSKLDYYTMDWDLMDEALGFKIFLDGSLGARTAALQQAYKDDPGNYGRLKYNDNDLLEIFQKAHRLDKPISCHVIGDRALAQFLRIVQKSRHSKDRLEHLNVADQKQLDTLAQLDIPVCISPAFSSDLIWAEQRLGKQRLQTSYVWNTLREKGIRLLVGTDAPAYFEDPGCITKLADKQEGMHHLDSQYTKQLLGHDNWNFYDWIPGISAPI